MDIPSGVMPDEPLCDISGEANIVTIDSALAAKDIDNPFRLRHVASASHVAGQSEVFGFARETA